GRFVIPEVPPGAWTIVASRLGYAWARVPCSLPEGTDTLHVLLSMTPSALPLEVLVVTASRREEPLDRVPAAVTVLRSRDVQERPADNYGSLLRNVPGVNVSQVSAFDMSISSRNATGVLPQGQLAMVDNRTVYQDFNGFVLWNAVPIDPLEVRQIEIVRGPGSAVWGANAVDGVIHVLTKSPREMKGTVIRAGGGELGAANIHAVHAAEHGRWSYRVSGGWSQQDPYDRPQGTIPGTEGPASPNGTPYPAYPNEGLDQPRGNARLDYQADERTTLSASGGYAGLSGIFLTPIGPYSFADAGSETFLKLDWIRKSTRISAFANRNDVDGRFLLSGEPSGSLTNLYDVSFSTSRNAGPKHVLAYGANGRHADYEIDFAPGAEARSSLGAYAQDEVTIARRWRWVLGARWDYIEEVGHAVSPRTGLLFSPVEDQTVRVSYNRAFLAPSAVEMHLDVQGATTFTIPTPGGPLELILPTHSKGNPDLESETLDAFELGWTGKAGRAIQLSLSLYRNVLSNHIQLVPTSFYTSTSPPPGWPLPDSLLDVPPPNGFAGIPSELRNVNLGEVTNQGVEVGLELHPIPAWSGFVNYSWQDVPSLKGSDPVPLPNGGSHDPINTPPRHRFNAGGAWRSESFYVDGDVNVQSEAFWTDVLDSRYWGPTEGFVGVNLGAGVHFSRERATLAVNARNLFDERIQQHVWGDILTRKVTAQLTLRL
ncbi:MAG TPA: TonB-dependent receptor, partial [Candidatus Eisenbacteria bacterium]|nr:TonB-dependent receptor [Candidatus Eisenbacteria bacterium]